MIHNLLMETTENIIANIPSDLKRIIYTYFLLKLRSEKRFNLLCYMNHSQNFRAYCICDILPQIMHPSKNNVKLQLLNGFYEVLEKQDDDWLFQINVPIPVEDGLNYWTKSEIFTRLLHVISTIGEGDLIK